MLFFRCLEDDLYEMICTLQIDAHLLQTPLAYKYVIFSPAMVEQDDCYEYLHFIANHCPDANRCIWVPEYCGGM